MATTRRADMRRIINTISTSMFCLLIRSQKQPSGNDFWSRKFYERMRFISSVVILCSYRRCLMKLLLSRQTPTQLTVPFDSSVLEGAFAGVNIFFYHYERTSEKLLVTCRFPWTTVIVGSNYKYQIFFCLRLQTSYLYLRWRSWFSFCSSCSSSSSWEAATHSRGSNFWTTQVLQSSWKRGTREWPPILRPFRRGLLISKNH